MTDHNPAEPDCPLNEEEGKCNYQPPWSSLIGHSPLTVAGECPRCERTCQCALIAKVLRRGVESVIAVIDESHPVFAMNMVLGGDQEYECHACWQEPSFDPEQRCHTTKAIRHLRSAALVESVAPTPEPLRRGDKVRVSGSQRIWTVEEAPRLQAYLSDDQGHSGSFDVDVITEEG